MAKRKTTDQVQINVRMREGLRAKLELSAKKNYESLNREIVDRLERSFDRQELLVEALTLAYGNHLAAILMALGKVMESAGKVARLATNPAVGAEPWHTDPFAYQEAMVAAYLLLRELRPRSEFVPPRPKMLEVMESLKETGELAAASVIADLRKPKDKWARSVRDLLGGGIPDVDDVADRQALRPEGTQAPGENGKRGKE
jgi:hypothetical protein